jgi:putative AbiEi antitoxin of type IV toxin-antitoxin system/uncharacterized protein DUF559
VVREAHDSHAEVVTPDRAVAEWARRQHGVVSLEQLRRAGLGRGAVAWRVDRGRLHPVHRGVYAVGHARLTARGRLWAALLACGGPGAAALSHRAAAALHDLLPTPGGAIDVTTFGRSASSDGIRVHRSRTLDPARDTLLVDGLTATAPMRTLIDLAGTLTPQRVARIVDRADVLRLLDAAALTEHLARHPTTKGGRALRAALDDLGDRAPHVARSELEERFLGLVHDAGLPAPELNAPLEGFVVDALWREDHLVVELDGAAAHLRARAFREDRRRDARLTVAGYRVVRFTHYDVTRHAAVVAATLAALTRRSSARARAPRARTRAR